MSQTSKLVSRDIGHCEHFHSVCMPMSLFSTLVVLVLSTRYEVTKLCCVFIFFVLTLRNCLVWPTYIRIPSIIVVVTYGYSQTCHVYGWRYHVYPPSGRGISMQLKEHLVGQLLLLLVQVWRSWCHSLRAVILIREQTRLICACLTEKWIARWCTLREP